MNLSNNANDLNDSMQTNCGKKMEHCQEKVNYNAGDESTYNIEVLKYNLCDYNDAYFLVKGVINVPAAPEIQIRFKNCVLFTKCITKIDGTIIDDAKD